MKTRTKCELPTIKMIVEIIKTAFALYLELKPFYYTCYKGIWINNFGEIFKNGAF